MHIFDELRKMKNYPTVCAGYSGLNGNVVYRQKPCWNKLKEHDRDIFTQEVKEITKRQNNHRNLRELINATDSDCISHIGTILIDLVFIDEGNTSL